MLLASFARQTQSLSPRRRRWLLSIPLSSGQPVDCVLVPPPHLRPGTSPTPLFRHSLSPLLFLYGPPPPPPGCGRRCPGSGSGSGGFGGLCGRGRGCGGPGGGGPGDAVWPIRAKDAAAAVAAAHYHPHALLPPPAERLLLWVCLGTHSVCAAGAAGRPCRQCRRAGPGVPLYPPRRQRGESEGCVTLAAAVMT